MYTKYGKILFFQQNKNILLLVNKSLSFDKELKGDFNLLEITIKRDIQNDLIYTGCQIINKDLFDSLSVSNFSISKVWNQLIDKNELYGYKSLVGFYHLTNLEVYKKIIKKIIKSLALSLSKYLHPVIFCFKFRLIKKWISCWYFK